MAQGRVQAPQLAGPVPLQGGQVPGDTFTGAPQPEINNNLGQIADALSGFNSMLNKWGSAEAKKNAKAQQDIETAAANKMILGHTRDEWNTMVENGQVPNFANPFARSLVEKHSGTMQADAITNDIQQRISRAGSDGGIDLLDPNTDISSVITEAAKQGIQNMSPQLQNSGPAMAGYRQRIDTFREALTLKQQQMREADFTKQLKGAAFDNFSKMIASTEKGASNDRVQSLVRGVYQDLSATRGGSLTNAQLDDELISAIKNSVGDPGKVDAGLHVLSTERTGLNGEKLPPLLSNPKYASQVQEIQSAARNTLMNRYDGDVKQKAIDSYTDALKRQDGSMWSFTNSTYTNPYALAGQGSRTLSVDEVRKAAVDRYLNWSQEQRLARHETPDITFDRDWNVLQGANIKNPVWKNQLEGAASSFTNPMALSDPAKRQEAIAAGELYLTAANRNGPYTKALVNKQAQDFYTVYDVARSQMNLNQDAALDMAAKAIRTSDNENDLAVASQKAKEVAQKVAGMNWGAHWYNSIPGLGASAENQGIIQKRVQDVATVLARTQDMTPDDAVKNAAELVQKRSMFVNGHVVPDNGTLPPQDTVPLIEKYLDVFAEQHGREYHIAKGTDLSVEPYGGNTLRIIDRGNGFGRPLWVKNAEGKVVPALITMPMLQSMKAQNDHNAAKGVEQLQQTNLRQTINSAHDRLDAREAALEGSSLGGAYYAAQKKSITEARAKLPARLPEPPPEPWEMTITP